MYQKYYYFGITVWHRFLFIKFEYKETARMREATMVTRFEEHSGCDGCDGEADTTETTLNCCFHFHLVF